MNFTCKVTRGNITESVHKVNAIAINQDQETIFLSGEENFSTCVRSTLKPFQASAAITSGATSFAGFTKQEIALMCASHNGEAIHLKTVQKMAEKLGVDESHYECGSHRPHDKQTRLNIKTPSVFHNNCSGKHSGMLAIAKKLNVKTSGYTQQTHPVQKCIFNHLSNIIGSSNFSTGIDGCSAPTPFLTLRTIAQLFLKLGSNEYSELITAYQAMSKHPYMVGGKNRFDTNFISALKGRGICKAGGEAIRGLVIRSNNYGLLGIAIKVLDGNQRAIEVATMGILSYLQLLNNKEQNQLIKYSTKKLFNHQGIHTGNIIAEIN